MPTGGARKAARATANEASEQLGKQGARQATLRGFASLDEAVKTVTTQRFEELPDTLYYYASPHTAALIKGSGKIKSRSGIVYLTSRGGMPPLQAQLELALPSHNTATHIFAVPKNLLDPNRVLLIRRVTGNVFNRPGGGVEILYRGPVYGPQLVAP